MTTKAIDRSPSVKPVSTRRYEADLYGWVSDQVALLRAQDIESIDASHITDELIDMGRSEFDKLVSAIRVVSHHLLKWDHQPERRSRSWVITIDEHRARIIHELRDSPSLRPRIEDAMSDAYRLARRTAARETGLSITTFPAANPYDWKTITSRLVSWGDETSPEDAA